MWSVACEEYPAVRSRLEALLSFVAAQHSTDGVALLLGVVQNGERMCLFVRVRWCDLVSLANVSMHVILSVAMVADDAHRGCDEAGESVPPEVEHDSQLAEGGGHVSTAAFRGGLCLCVPGTSYRNSVRNVWSVTGDLQQFFFFF